MRSAFVCSRLVSSFALLAILILVCNEEAAGEDRPQLMGQPAAGYQARRQTLMEQIAEESGDRPTVVVLRGSDRGDREDFEEGRFRQNNPFAYLAGVEIPGSYLVLLPKEQREILYLPPGRLGTAFSGGDRPIPPPVEETARRLGVGEVASTSRLLADLFGAIADPLRPSSGLGLGFPKADRAVVYTILPTRRRPESPEGRFVEFLRQGAPSTEFRDLTAILGELRKVKSDSELAILRRAIAITSEALTEVARTVQPGAFEHELEGALIGAFLKKGALRPGFAPIIGSGPNSCIPHYFANDRQMEAGDLVVVDIGAEVLNYTADITRTFPVSGTFNDRQRELYQLVLETQEHVASQIVPGETTLGELTGLARAFFRESPLRAKDEEGREQSMDHFFIHGLSHYLGMDVHDVGSTSQPMQPGEVFTIEPGLYIPTEKIGIRIEDDYLITPDGLCKLSRDIPSDPEAIERWMAASEEASKLEAVP